VGETLLDGMRRVQRKAWELLSKSESEGNHRDSIVVLREMIAKANEVNGKSVDQEKCDFSVLSEV
jgi:hypothetical protein